MTKKIGSGITIVVIMVFLLLTLLTGTYIFWKKNYYNKVYPNITIGSLNLSKQSLVKVKKNINNRATQIENQGLSFRHGQKEITIESVVSSFDSDLSYPALLFDVNKTAAKAFNHKFPQTFGDFLKQILKSEQDKKITAVYTLDEKRLEKRLNESFPELTIPAINARFFIANNQLGEIRLKTKPARIGKEINYPKLFKELEKNLENLENKTIIIKTETAYPSVEESDLNILKNSAQKIINQGPLFLEYEQQKWVVKPQTLISWFSAKRVNGLLELYLDPKQIARYLQKVIAPEINQEVVRPKFEVENNKVTNWVTGANGQKLEISKSSQKIDKEMLIGKRVISLDVKKITNDNYIPKQGFRIKEILGTGHSSFIGSPSNRRHNIKTGLKALNGLLIKPNEEFSLVKALGEIDKKTGYLPELVIKGNKTIPEYGGGLCQVATTIFRAAIRSGLPITERRNHSYRVSYYEPAGTDATVYDPQPDFRFINNTGNYILIQTRIENKNDLYFDFWGVKDGRTVKITKPIISDIVKPKPTKLIETTELPPGKKKCTERSHNGADAYFDYTVTYPAGATTTPVQKVRFNSHYVPWQEVCLIGVATSTTSTIEIKK